MLINHTIRQWFSKAQTISFNNDTKALPDLALAYLNRQIQLLSHHPHYQVTIQTALQERRSQWMQGAVPNSLVILSSPSENLSVIINQVVQEEQDERIHKLFLLQASPDRNNLIQQISKLNLHAANTEKQLVVIPSLDAFFLRTIAGLEIMEQFLDVVNSFPTCFWLIGCNRWTWQYLDAVSQFASYFDATVQLPKLTGDQLHSWLSSLLGELTLDWGAESSEAQEGRSQRYFENLAQLSLGLSQVAAHLWIHSLRYPQPDQQDEEESSSPLLSEVILKVRPAVLPDLPSLIAEDRFLLYALLLHRQMKGDQLALSLGEPQGKVRAQCRQLLQTGILSFQQGDLTVHPAYYPR
ncbi:MAG: hypothetical protein HC921_16200 [Synechococcaceae cyanobacterium SM2_3_1]|nr:hypothetical protein [Synechococcaceae cyanobacterium SM2_3_1]